MTKTAWIERVLWAGLLMGVMALPATAQTAQQKKMQDQLKQLDQLDQLDRLEFAEHLEHASSCIRARYFDCAEEKINKADKVAGNAQDKQALSLARQNLLSERKLQQQEQLAEQRERNRIAAAEARRQAEIEEQAAAERRREEREASAQTWRALGAIAAGAAVGNASRGLSAEQQQRAVRSAMQGVLDGDTSQFNATTNQISAERTQAHNAQMQTIREQRFREEAAARAQRQQQAQTAAAQLAQEQERQRVANQSRQQYASAQYAQAQQAQDQRAREQQDREKTEKQKREQGQKEAMQQAREQKIEQERQDRIAKQEAEKAAKAKAESDFLAEVKKQFRLVAGTCPGGEGRYFALGVNPNIKPEIVACYGIQFRAICRGGGISAYGATSHFRSGAVNCFAGEAVPMEPKLGCKPEEVQITVTEVTPCFK